jgi:hypothetical protein
MSLRCCTFCLRQLSSYSGYEYLYGPGSRHRYIISVFEIASGPRSLLAADLPRYAGGIETSAIAFEQEAAVPIEALQSPRA